MRRIKSRPVFYPTYDDGLTDVSQARDCDINVLMARFKATGQLPLSGKQGQYMDLVGVPGDLAAALEVVETAKNAFFALPAKVRERFGNDPIALDMFLADPANMDEAISLGLVSRKDPDPDPSASEQKKGGSKEPPVTKASKKAKEAGPAESSGNDDD